MLVILSHLNQESVGGITSVLSRARYIGAICYKVHMLHYIFPKVLLSGGQLLLRGDIQDNNKNAADNSAHGITLSIPEMHRVVHHKT